jgi:hypothetical protein
MNLPSSRRPSTLGDLIVALTDEASQFVRGKEEIYRVVAYLVSDILFQSRVVSASWH